MSPRYSLQADRICTGLLRGDVRRHRRPTALRLHSALTPCAAAATAVAAQRQRGGWRPCRGSSTEQRSNGEMPRVKAIGESTKGVPLLCLLFKFCQHISWWLLILWCSLGDYWCLPIFAGFTFWNEYHALRVLGGFQRKHEALCGIIWSWRILSDCLLRGRAHAVSDYLPCLVKAFKCQCKWTYNKSPLVGKYTVLLCTNAIALLWQCFIVPRWLKMGLALPSQSSFPCHELPILELVGGIRRIKCRNVAKWRHDRQSYLAHSS